MILNSSASPIKVKTEEEEKVGNSGLLFEEDVVQYEDFLKKSSYLDSPSHPSGLEPCGSIIGNEPRITAGFG